MEGLAAALVESGEREEEEEEDNNVLQHWSALNSLSASFTANLPPLSSMRKIILETFLHIREELLFYSSPLFMLFYYYSTDCIFNFSNIFNPK